MSYFVTYTTSKGKDITIWAKNLDRVISENSIQRGEYCRFAITDKMPRTITIKDKKNPNIVYSKVVYEKKWNVSVEKRLKRELNPLKRSSKSTYSTINTATTAHSQQRTTQSQGTPSHTPHTEQQRTAQYQRKDLEF